MNVLVAGYGEIGSIFGQLIRAAQHRLFIFDPPQNYYVSEDGCYAIIHICVSVPVSLDENPAYSEEK